MHAHTINIEWAAQLIFSILHYDKIGGEGTNDNEIVRILKNCNCQ